jgi:hypothetical protein
MAKGKQKSYIIYKITNGKDVYVGMTTQSLAARLQQHKKDAGTDACSITNKLCKKKIPPDLKALHRRLRDHPQKFSIHKIKEMTSTYNIAHKEELALKAKHSNI